MRRRTFLGFPLPVLAGASLLRAQDTPTFRADTLVVATTTNARFGGHSGITVAVMNRMTSRLGSITLPLGKHPEVEASGAN
jgi:hypothetical protein